MQELTNIQLRTLSKSFALLDFSQPKAHEMFRMLETILKNYLIDHNLTSEREFRFYKLGEQTAFAKCKFDSIPPLTNVPTKSEGSQ